MTSENIRLRIELNSMIKFYVKINERSILSDLKKLINNILFKNYGITLPSYSLRSIDGFEILEIFRLGDILEDNQIILVDAFTHSYKPRSYSYDRLYERNTASIENSVEKAFERSSEKANNKDKITTGDKTSSIRSEQVLPIQENEQSVNQTIPVKQRVEIPSEQPVVTEVKIEKRTIEKQVQKLEEPKVEEIPQPVAPPRPDNFKGFVIKKSDLNKKQNIVVDDSSFKPLKKRKVEVEEFDL